MNKDHIIHVGSRKSELALIQTNHVISLLKAVHPEKEFKIVTMSTIGDKVLDIPLPKIGEKSLFTRELEAALATGCVDFVVHSLKDLPTSLPENMAIGAVVKREDPRDALVLHQDYKDHTLETLPEGSVIGTSSLRRAAQLHKYYPHLKVENIRGNLNTRLKKLDDLNHFRAIILATAGLERMGWENRISKRIEEDSILYAVGQGAIAVECREKDQKTLSLLKPLYDVHTAVQIIAERAFLKTLGGGCSAPVAVKTDLVKINGCKYELALTGAVWSLDGADELKDKNGCELQIASNSYCSLCPYRDGASEDAKCVKNTDIECLHACNKRHVAVIENETNGNNNEEVQEERACKRLKVNHDVNSPADTSILTKEAEAHDKCPVALPIGADFMGKCPYLESHTLLSKCPVGGHIEGVNDLNIGKCPYMKSGEFVFTTASDENKNEQEQANVDLFCGLVSHPDVSIQTFRDAEKLGRDLADSLISKGANDIMTKAQAIIRNT